jgi:septum formation protein
LLSQFGRAFEVVPADLDEDGLTTSDPEETARILSLAKARHVLALRPEALVMGGDTVVALGNRQFGKPRDAAEAASILRELSGRTHRVLSGLALAWEGGEAVDVEAAEVEFRVLEEPELLAYAATAEPRDKAGGYAIQGEAAKFIASVRGERDCVVGFPTLTFRRLTGL